MKRLFSIILALSMITAIFASCSSGEKDNSSDDWAYIEEKGKLVIGITIYEPINYYDEDGKLIGFDTEFAQAVCDELGIEAEFVEINWDTKEIELEAKNIDCIWNGLTVTEVRKEQMDFSESYIKNMQVAVIKASNASVYTDSASMKDANITAEIGSAGESAITADDTLSKANYVGVAKQSDALLEVKAGTSDIAILDYVMADAMVGEGTDYSDLMMVENFELAAEEYAIGFRLGSNAVAKINEVIDKLVENGKLDEIAAKYELQSQLISNQ